MEEGKAVKIKDLDLQILNELLKDAQRSFRQLAKDLQESSSTIYNRIKKMEESSIIKKFTVDIDYDKLNYDITAIVFISVNKSGDLQDEAKKLAEISNVFDVYLISGDYDIMVKVKAQSVGGLSEFINTKIRPLPFVEKTKTQMVLDTVVENRVNLELIDEAL